MVKEKKYEGWLVSNNFLKRSFAVWGHFMVAHLIIVFGVLLTIFILALIIGIFAGIFSAF